MGSYYRKIPDGFLPAIGHRKDLHGNRGQSIIMNILQVNKFHYIRGGAEVVYFSTADILKRYGHRVVFFSIQNPNNLTCEYSSYFMPYIDLENTDSVINKVKAAGRIFYSFEARKRLSRLLDRYPVDIAHLHSISHYISPSILHELKQRKIPVVMSLHEFKVVCASYYFLVDGKSCEACRGGKYFMVIKNRCVRESLAKSILCATEMYLHNKVLDIYRNVDLFISTSLFQKSKLIEMGFNKEMVYLPNFIDIQKFRQFNTAVESESAKNNRYIIYIGRLSSEKGLFTLLEAAKLISRGNKEIEIKMSGDGPIREKLQEKVKAEKINNVRFLGYIKHEDLCQEIKNSLAVVLPSECYENNPVSVMEAFAMGVPLIGARIGGIPELVRNNETGLTFEPGDSKDLASKIEYMANNPDEAAEMGEKARAFVEQELNAEKHYQKLMEIYKRVIRRS